MSDAAGPANPSSPSNPPGTGDRGSESRANAPKRGSEGRPAAARSFQAPKGTRDFYPADLLRRRYIIDTWRRVSLRHGFEEIDGPTFEDSDLYTVKSGEGILNELFGAYSGKDPNDTKQVQAGGPPPFALRPEFTPTLARMYAARARQLPQPTKWFCVSNFFRAERPQRGRLREFWQWNADVIGGDSNQAADVETIELCLQAMREVGLSHREDSPDAFARMLRKQFHERTLDFRKDEEGVSARINDRNSTIQALKASGVDDGHLPAALAFVDKHGISPEQVKNEHATTVGIDWGQFVAVAGFVKDAVFSVVNSTTKPIQSERLLADYGVDTTHFYELWQQLRLAGVQEWCEFDPTIVRGLAYYTGTVFELIAEGERAVAGGGRYDKLIELFGGPPTPAVGFGMGDVVLTNLLDDRKLMPEGKDLLEACSRPLPVRCDVFVVANEKDEAQAQVVPTVAALRRGVESEKYRQGGCKPWSLERYDVVPLHARRSYKTTKNIGKLLGDATACHARFALIIEDAEKGTLKNLDTREEFKDVALSEVGKRVAGGPGL